MNLQHGLDLTEEKLSPTPFPLTLGYACDTTGMGGGEGEREETRFMGRKGKGENGTLKKTQKRTNMMISKLFDL